TAYLRDITERKRAEQASRFLADASKSLATLADHGSTLQKVARLAVPFFADGCAVDLMEPDGSVRQVDLVLAVPATIELAHQPERRYPLDPNAAHGVPNVLRTGKSEMMADISDAVLVASAQDQEQLRILRMLGMKSSLCVPLVARGKTVGVLTFFAAESCRRFDATRPGGAESPRPPAGHSEENRPVAQRGGGARPPQGRVPGDAGPRTAQPLGPDPQCPAHHETARCGRCRGGAGAGNDGAAGA